MTDRLQHLREKYGALTAAPDVEDDTLCIVALPAADDPVHEVGEEERERSSGC